MSRISKRLVAAVGAAGLAVAGAGVAAASPDWNHGGDRDHTRHVLLISVDGLHQSDLAWYVAHNPGSALAKLVGGGLEYTNAQTTNPSDSFPGMIAQFTGGTSAVTGVYYDDTYNHDLLPAGTTTCTPGEKTGAEVPYTEQDDKNQNSIDAGQGLSGLPNSILGMTGQPQTLIDPSQLPVDPATCKPVYPNQYLQVNTVFDIAHQAGLRTAWSDKHPAYSILDGKSGNSIDDLFTPEINSAALGYPAGNDWTTDNAATQQYDSYKVQAVVNEIDGYDHSRTDKVGVPAIFGMNFQTVSTAEKLPTSDGLTGGYLADGVTPGPLLSRGLDYINTQVGTFQAEIKKQHLEDSTTIILSAKHGQSPTNPAALTRIPDGPIVDGLNAAWKAAHPGAGDLVAFNVDDDAMLFWLNDRSQAAADFAKNYLLTHSGTGNDINGNPKPYTASGLAQVFAGKAAADYFGANVHDPRHPDLVGVVQYGVVYTGGHGKIAEHGGAAPQDRDVPLVVSGSAVQHAGVVTAPVQTTQIAPTMLAALGLDPGDLQAVHLQHTDVLPRLEGGRD